MVRENRSVHYLFAFLPSVRSDILILNFFGFNQYFTIFGGEKKPSNSLFRVVWWQKTASLKTAGALKNIFLKNKIPNSNSRFMIMNSFSLKAYTRQYYTKILKHDNPGFDAFITAA